MDRSLYMDDVLVVSIDKSNPVQKMVQEVDTALNKGNFQVKQWTKTGDTGQVKFFSYMYHPQFDTFNVRPPVNWSPRKRGARSAPDVKNIAELQEHAKLFQLTVLPV